MQEGESSSTDCEALQLLCNPQRLHDERFDSGALLRKLADHPNMLKDMLYISFRPEHFQRTRALQLTPELPARATDTLCTLYEDLINLLANDGIVDREQALQGLEGLEEEQQGESQGECVDSSSEGKEEFVLLRHIHRAFEDGECDDASLSNLSRILGPLYFHCPERMMRFYQLCEQQRRLLLSSLGQRAVMEIFLKLLETEAGRQFFKEYKQRYLDDFFSEVLNRGEQWLESLLQLHRFITEKMEERYDGGKYVCLLPGIVKQDMLVLGQAVQRLGQYSDAGVLLLVRVTEEVLKQDSCVMGSNDLKMSISSINRKNSLSANFYAEDKGKSSATHKLSQSQLDGIGEALRAVEQRLQTAKEPTSLLFISYYRTLYFWLKVLAARRRDGLTAFQQQIGTMLSEAFFTRTFCTILQHPRSTILHNCLKELLLHCLKQDIVSPQYFLKAGNPYLNAVLEWLPRERRKAVPFGAQIYHILLQVLRREGQSEGALWELVVQERKRRETEIGGCDAHKMHDCLRGSANNYSSSSDEFIEIDIPSQNSCSPSSQQQTSSSFSGSSLLSRPASLERGFLPEEQIVIEGAEGSDEDGD